MQFLAWRRLSAPKRYGSAVLLIVAAAVIRLLLPVIDLPFFFSSLC